MNKAFKIMSYTALSTLVCCQSPQSNHREDAHFSISETTEHTSSKKKKIKLAILLDTSNSMDGLIEQAKNQLWKIVNQLAKAKDEHGEDPEVEIALFQYGNDGLTVFSGFVEQVSPFTTELDEISEKLFALTTNGGAEYCGTVIKQSLEDLLWSNENGDLQLIFIAGNEEFNQGFVNYKKACQHAKENNIVVNTIYCGDYNEGINIYWKDGADITGGKYMNIDQDAEIVHIDSPYDKQITDLNNKLNGTYIPYGKSGFEKQEKQIQQDANASSYGSVNTTKRVISKSSKIYKNTSWDLVDASSEKGFDIKKIDKGDLPENMRSMNAEEKIIYIEKRKIERQNIKDQIQELAKQREVYVAKVKTEQALKSSQNQLDDAIIAAIVDQAEKKSFVFND